MENLFIEQETQDLLEKYVYLLKKKGVNSTKLEAIEQDRFYSFLINYLTCLDIPESEAKRYYYRIVEHKTTISQKLGRDVGLPVAALDYFHNIEGNIKNPKTIENELFEQLLNQSKIDPKTKSYHLSFFKEMLQTEIARADRYKHNVSIMMLDIDDFKGINDRFGHEFADRVLENFSEQIQESLRTEDVLGRYGGDEFIILLPHTGRVGARVMGERIKINISKYFEQKQMNITFSAGIATYPYDTNSVDTLIDNADKALYRSKKLGKNRIYDYLEENSMKEEKEEKRQAIRYPLSPPLPIDMKDSEGLIHISGQALNISSSGLLIECLCEVNEEILTKNLTVQLKEMLGKQEPALHLKGSVVRLDMNQLNYKFNMALQFEENLQSPLIQNLGKIPL